jgi:hypothetical protein
MTSKFGTITIATLGLAALETLGLYGVADAFEPPKAPCSVLTPQEVAAAIGANSGARQIVSTLCEWDASGHPGKFTLGFLSASAWEQTKAMRERIKGFERTPISGLGEEAVFSTNGMISTLQVKKGSAVLDMHLYGIAPDNAKGKEVILAKAALGRF